MAKFQLWQDGMMVAMVECENRHSAMKEIAHYAAVYEQDGPVKIVEVKPSHPVSTSGSRDNG